MYEYYVVELTAEDGSTVYGMNLRINYKTVCRLSILYPNREKMERIAAFCTKERVEPIHVQDIAYDIILE